MKLSLGFFIYEPVLLWFLSFALTLCIPIFFLSLNIPNLDADELKF